MEKTDNSRFIALVLRWQVMQVLLDARPSITLGRQKRTRECYYLELFRGLLLKQWEIGHSKYVFLLSVFSSSIFLAKNTFSTEKNARVLLFGTVAWVPFETAGNLPCKICFFLLVLFSEKNA